MRTAILFFFCIIRFCPSYCQIKSETIDLNTEDDIDSIRKVIKQKIWPHGVDDSARIISIDQDIDWVNEVSPELNYLENLATADKIKLRLGSAMESSVYLLHPVLKNNFNIPVIYHGGHDGFLWEDRYLNNSGRPYSISVIDFLLGKGFDVIAIDMPLCGFNSNPQEIEEDGQTFFLYTHNDIFQLKNPFYYFLEPVRRMLDYMEINYGCKNFIMAGLSGGGWTTTLLSAIDTRITQSYAVAGSIPIPLRIRPSDYGDEEQNYEAFYNQFNYSTLYTLASFGKNRLHYQILNDGDDCCFDFDGNKYWVPNVQEKLKSLGDKGKFLFYYDPYATMHKISSATVDSMYESITNDLLVKNIPYTVQLNANESVSTLCNGEVLELNSKYNEGDFLQWYRNGKPIKDEVNSVITLEKQGKYFLKDSNVTGILVRSDTIIVRTVKLSKPLLVERNDTLYSNFDGKCQWYLNGNFLTETKTNWIKPLQQGSYTVISVNRKCTSEPSDPYQIGITIYPNPTIGTLNIHLAKSIGNVQLNMFNNNGVLILSDQFAGEKVLNLYGRLPKGVYYLRLSNSKGIIRSEKVVIL